MKIIAVGHSLSDLLNLKRKYKDEDTKIITYISHNFLDHLALLKKRENHKIQPAATYNSAVWLRNNFGINIIPMHEILMIDHSKKLVRIKSIKTKDIFEEYYDLLSISNKKTDTYLKSNILKI